MANVRQYQDTTALVVLLRCARPGLLRTHVLPLLRDCSTSNSYALSSLILIVARVLVAQLLPATAPAASAARRAPRHNEGGQLQSPEQQEEEEQQQQLAAQGRQPAAMSQLDEEQRGLLAEVVACITPWALTHVHALRCGHLACAPHFCCPWALQRGAC
jgi:hypothetical protein